jgi:hypothetical protein
LSGRARTNRQSQTENEARKLEPEPHSIFPHLSFFPQILQLPQHQIRFSNAKTAKRVPPSDFWKVYLPWQVGLVTWKHHPTDPRSSFLNPHSKTLHL